MSEVLLDTDILSEYLKGHDKVVARHAASYFSQHGVFTFTSVTVHEIVFGLEFKGASGQLAKALAWLNQNEQITPNVNDYQEAAIIRATARKQGSILELPDCLIAAVALRLGLPLVTGNTEDFQAIQRTGVKLTIENWREAQGLHDKSLTSVAFLCATLVSVQGLRYRAYAQLRPFACSGVMLVLSSDSHLNNSSRVAALKTLQP